MSMRTPKNMAGSAAAFDVTEALCVTSLIHQRAVRPVMLTSHTLLIWRLPRMLNSNCAVFYDIFHSV